MGELISVRRNCIGPGDGINIPYCGGGAEYAYRRIAFFLTFAEGWGQWGREFC